MTIPNWPDELPLPTQAGYSHQPDDPRTKRPREAGPPGYRRRFSSVARTMKLSIVVDRNERQIFWDFYRDDCGDGTKPFYMPDPVTDGWPFLTTDGVNLQTDDGTPMLLARTMLCLWDESVPSETIKGVQFEISYSVVEMP